jgi:hypothetical protein
MPPAALCNVVLVPFLVILDQLLVVPAYTIGQRDPNRWPVGTEEESLVVLVLDVLIGDA